MIIYAVYNFFYKWIIMRFPFSNLNQQNKYRKLRIKDAKQTSDNKFMFFLKWHT